MIGSRSLGLLVGASLFLPASGALAVTETIIHNFANDGVDGNTLRSALMQDKKGNFWGTTYDGGASSAGTVFEITAKGAYSIVHNFANDGVDGNNPDSALIQDKQGNFWGTTSFGGLHGHGTVFEITAAGAYSVVQSLDGGYGPGADSIIQDKKGNFWGTTVSAGANELGSVFEITAAGVFSVAHSFNGGDGASLSAGVIQDKKGNFWGITYVGGANGVGTVFEITAKGSFSVVHNFAADGIDGYKPQTALMLDKQGNLWGTTYYGGANGVGTVFEITTAGAYSVVHSFDGADGNGPSGRLIQDKQGNLWGTTIYGGANNIGAVFEITTAGAFSVVHSFAADGIDGTRPDARLIQDKKGNFWGTTYDGGAHGVGTVFKLTP